MRPLLLTSLLLLALLPLAAVGDTPPWPSSYWDIPGEFCSKQYPSGRCCAGRKDPCSVSIFGTLCYCDHFCNRTGNSDCCPDYFTHCEGLKEPMYAHARPEEIVRPEDVECPSGEVVGRGRGGGEGGEARCFHNGRYYSVRDTAKENCNECRCQQSPSNPRCMELLCETNLCAVDEATLAELSTGWRAGQYMWRPVANSTDLWGRTLDEAMRKRLGTERPKHPVSGSVRDMSAINFRYSPSDLPASFDAREKWPGKVHGILDQGWCGASWAFSTISVASDRFAVEGQSLSDLSAQSLISCNTQGQSGCRGGSVDRAWNFLRRFGTAPDECYPYTSSAGYAPSDSAAPPNADATCRLPRSHRHDTARMFDTCPELQDRRALFKTQPAYRVGRRNTRQRPRRMEQDVMFEIMTHGPVQASMEVYSDFFMYDSGIYQKTNLASRSKIGFHSVKIVGWGEEKGVKFWLCTNSWGDGWGESGLFRILRGQNECLIEDFVVGVWAQTEKHVKAIRERRRRRLRKLKKRKRKSHGAMQNRLRRRRHHQ